MQLNETPVRTSKNYGINNIKLENVDFPELIKAFENIEIVKTNSEIYESVSNTPLTYGNGKIVEENVIENANNTIRIVTTEKDEDISIIYEFDEDNLNLINQIELEANGNTNIVIKYKSNTDDICFHNGIIRIKANENVKVNVTIINLLNEKSEHFEAYQNEILNNAEVNYTIIDIGAKDSISNYYSNVIGNNAKNDLKTIYLGLDEQIKDINYIVELRGKKSHTDIDVQGALKDNAKKNFKGTIDFKKGCKQAYGNENEYCMLLSDTAKSIALPMLLCTESDVEGNHSSASGKVDSDALFYIMTRGLTYTEAVKLIVKARFEKIIERICNDKLEEEILKEIDKKMD